MDPIIAAAIAGPVSVLVVKAIDVAMARSQESRSERDELREDLKMARKEADDERAQRRQAETDLDTEQKKSRQLRSQLDTAEDQVRESRDLQSKVHRLKSERELDRARCRQDKKQLQDRIAELRKEVRRLGGNTGPLRR